MLQTQSSPRRIVPLILKLGRSAGALPRRASLICVGPRLWPVSAASIAPRLVFIALTYRFSLKSIASKIFELVRRLITRSVPIAAAWETVTRFFRRSGRLAPVLT